MYGRSTMKMGMVGDHYGDCSHRGFTSAGTYFPVCFRIFAPLIFRTHAIVKNELLSSVQLHAF